MLWEWRNWPAPHPADAAAQGLAAVIWWSCWLDEPTEMTPAPAWL